MNDTMKKIRKASLALLPPIFGKCVADRDYRYSLSAPFVHDDWIMATDGRILVRTKIESLGAAGPVVLAILGLAGSERKIPTLKYWQELQWDTARTPLPELPGAVPCEECNQERYVFNEDYEQLMPCDHCEGTGWFFDRHQRVFLEGPPLTAIGLGFAWTLKRLEADLFLVVGPVGTDEKGKPKHQPLRWESADAEGILMPMDFDARQEPCS